MRDDLTRAAPGRSTREPVSVVERHVARIHVEHEDAVAFEGAEDGLDLPPARAEFLLLLRAPVGEDLVGEVGGSSSRAPAKSRTKGRLTIVISMHQRSSS